MMVENPLRVRWNCPVVLQAARSMEEWSKANENWYNFCVFNAEGIFSVRWSIVAFIFSEVKILVGHSYKEDNVNANNMYIRKHMYCDAH